MFLEGNLQKAASKILVKLTTGGRSAKASRPSSAARAPAPSSWTRTRPPSKRWRNWWRPPDWPHSKIQSPIDNFFLLWICIFVEKACQNGLFLEGPGSALKMTITMWVIRSTKPDVAIQLWELGERTSSSELTLFDKSELYITYKTAHTDDFSSKKFHLWY